MTFNEVIEQACKQMNIDRTEIPYDFPEGSIIDHGLYYQVLWELLCKRQDQKHEELVRKIVIELAKKIFQEMLSGSVHLQINNDSEALCGKTKVQYPDLRLTNISTEVTCTKCNDLIY